MPHPPPSVGPKVINKRYDATAPITSVTPHPKNPRRGNAAAIDESIDDNGFYGAIVVQESTGHILLGNGRWKSAVAHKMTTIPVIFIDVDDRRALKIMLTDNRTSDLADYATSDLGALLDDLRATAELYGTGYTPDDVQSLLDDLGNATLNADDDQKKKRKRTTKLNAPGGGDVTHSLAVLVECPDEATQERAFHYLSEAGYTCRVLTL